MQCSFQLRTIVSQDVHCRMLHWTVTDTAVSPSQGFMLYSSITPVVHMVGCLSSVCSFCTICQLDWVIGVTCPYGSSLKEQLVPLVQ